MAHTTELELRKYSEFIRTWEGYKATGQLHKVSAQHFSKDGAYNTKIPSVPLGSTSYPVN
jgi:hypothetical protein